MQPAGDPLSHVTRTLATSVELRGAIAYALAVFGLMPTSPSCAVAGARPELRSLLLVSPNSVFAVVENVVRCFIGSLPFGT